MSLTYGFYNSQNSDRRYNAEQMAAVFDCLINDGVQMNIGDCLMLKTVLNKRQIAVGSGRAWFNSTWSYNDADYVLSVDSVTASNYKRIDAVCLVVNKNTSVRANSIQIVKGTASTAPKKPTIPTATNVYYHVLGWYTIGYGDTQIAAANIENNVGVGEPFITGILETVSADKLLAQWKNDFYDWFENIKTILDTNTVTRLEQAIEKVSIKETTANLYGYTHQASKTGYTHQDYMTDAILKDVYNKVAEIDSKADMPLGGYLITSNTASYSNPNFVTAGSYIDVNKSALKFPYALNTSKTLYTVTESSKISTAPELEACAVDSTKTYAYCVIGKCGPYENYHSYLYKITLATGASTKLYDIGSGTNIRYVGGIAVNTAGNVIVMMGCNRYSHTYYPSYVSYLYISTDGGATFTETRGTSISEYCSYTTCDVAYNSTTKTFLAIAGSSNKSTQDVWTISDTGTILSTSLDTKLTGLLCQKLEACGSYFYLLSSSNYSSSSVANSISLDQLSSTGTITKNIFSDTSNSTTKNCIALCKDVQTNKLFYFLSVYNTNQIKVYEIQESGSAVLRRTLSPTTSLSTVYKHGGAMYYEDDVLFIQQSDTVVYSVDITGKTIKMNVPSSTYKFIYKVESGRGYSFRPMMFMRYDNDTSYIYTVYNYLLKKQVPSVSISNSTVYVKIT